MTGDRIQVRFTEAAVRNGCLLGLTRTETPGGPAGEVMGPVVSSLVWVRFETGEVRQVHPGLLEEVERTGVSPLCARVQDA